MNPDPDLTIVLLGKAGVGKSASGNTILARTEFESKLSYKAVTNQICEERGNVFGKLISVVDTPGILDTKDTEEKIKMFCQHLLQSSRCCLFLVVLRVERFTDEDQAAVRAAMRVLGPQGMKNSYLLFTGGDALKHMSLYDFIFEDEKGPLPDVVTVFAGAYHLFNNEVDDDKQVRELLLKSGHLITQEHPDFPADDSKDRRIVLLGLPGAGKSSSGNTILRSEKFKSGCDFNSITPETVSESAVVEGRKVTVVDTPGITDGFLTPAQLSEEIMKSIVEASPGPHAFVVVVRIGRITERDIKLFELLPKLFDSDVCDAHQYSMVLFTHGDELKGKSIDDLIKNNRHVLDLVSMCGGRYCVFDNKAKKSREQVRHFLNKIEEMVTANGGEHFTSDLFRMAERFIKEEINQSGGIKVVLGNIWNKMKPFVLRHKRKIIICAVLGLIVGTALTIGLAAPALLVAGGAAEATALVVAGGTVEATALVVAGGAAGAVEATALVVAGGAAGAVGATAFGVAGGAAGAVGATALGVAGGAAGAVGATALGVAGGAAGAVGATAFGVAGGAAGAVGATALGVAGGAAGAVGATALGVAGGAAGAVGATALGVAGGAAGAGVLSVAGAALGGAVVGAAGGAAGGAVGDYFGSIKNQ